MAWYDTDSWSGDDYFEEYADSNPDEVNEILFGDAMHVDMHAQELFMEAFFNDNDAAYIDLVEYMHDEYDIDFEDAFDWQDFREWYDAQ